MSASLFLNRYRWLFELISPICCSPQSGNGIHFCLVGGEGDCRTRQFGWLAPSSISRSSLHRYLTPYFQSLPHTNKCGRHKNPSALCSETHKPVFSWNETKSGRPGRLLSVIWLSQTISWGSKKEKEKKDMQYKPLFFSVKSVSILKSTYILSTGNQTLKISFFCIPVKGQRLEEV